MYFSGKRINKIERYTKRADLMKRQYVYCPIADTAVTFQRVGFYGDTTIGDTILPSVLGPTSKFNAHGKWNIRKDKPMESRIVGQKIWRWREFRGRYSYEDKERIINDERMCYPREFVAPPGLEVTVQIVEGHLRLVTELPEKSSPSLLLHAVNLYLELFGQCHLTDKPDEVPIVTPKRVNWRILPSGVDPWIRSKSAVEERTKDLSADQQFIIAERQRFICSLQPSEVYVGEGGFSSYLAYVFEEKGLAVLESVTLGNAIYVFDREWREVSQLSKAQILEENLHKARIIHATGWPEQLSRALATS